MINYLINQFKWTSHLIPIHTSLTHLLRYIILQQCSRLSPKDTMHPPSWLFSFTLRHGIMSSVQKEVSSSHLSYCFDSLIDGKFPWVMLNHPCSHFPPLKDQPTGPASNMSRPWPCFLVCPVTLVHANIISYTDDYYNFLTAPSVCSFPPLSSPTKQQEQVGQQGNFTPSVLFSREFSDYPLHPEHIQWLIRPFKTISWWHLSCHFLYPLLGYF